MEVTTLSKSQFERLKKFDPGEELKNVEADLFILGSERSKKPRKLLKKFRIEEGEYFGKKMLNINTLLYYKKALEEVSELVLPESLAVTGGRLVGYTMPFIERSTNLMKVLNGSHINLEDKISYLKQVGTVLEKLEGLKNFPHEIHLGDVHEANFIIDENGKIRVVDLDSAYISNNKPFQSKYLFLSPILPDFPYKYKLDEDGDVIPSRDSDLYCYTIMLLNTLARTNICIIPIDAFYNYMAYLEDLGIDQELLMCIEKIYHNGPNENPLPYLDSLPIKRCYEASHLVYKQRTGVDLSKF